LIQEIKQQIGGAAEHIIASGLNLKKTGKKYHCPNIYAHKHMDKDPSMSWDKNLLQFYCFTCGHKIDIYGYYREHLNYTHEQVIAELTGVSDPTTTSMHRERLTLRQQVDKLSPITEQCIRYLEGRGITRDIIKRYQLRSYKGMIAFPYIRYTTAVGMKLRQPIPNPKPKYTSMTGSKPWFFGAQLVDPSLPELVICEGEICCLSLAVAGVRNAVSVGAGAKAVRSLVKQAEEWLANFDVVIVASDNDEAGMEMDKAFVELLGDKVKLVDKRLMVYKDLNDHLVKIGPEAVEAIINSARVKVEGRRDLDIDPYRGLTKETGMFIPTGLPSVDNEINDLAPGRVTVLTGRSSSGKTTIVKQIIANAIGCGAKVYLVNGENDPEYFLNDLYSCIMGGNEEYYTLIQINKKTHKEPKPDILKALQKWHEGKLVMFNKGESRLKTLDQLFKVIEDEVKFRGHNLVVLDNMMSLLSASAVEKNELQGEFVQKCCDLAKIYRCHIILVVHPNKTYQNETDMQMEQVSGSSDIYNKADNFIAVVRYYKDDRKFDGKLLLLKNRIYGTLAVCDLKFDPKTRLLLEDREGFLMRYKFNFNPREVNGKSREARGCANKPWYDEQ